ncbi:MAG TPA: hypothetical protein VHT96_12885 [Clostridia bacterium]|nr:hypothetical protein [Clostridia bacterium]
MLIDTSVTIAYKCNSCGSFEFFNISLFTLLHKKNYCLSCRCKKSRITIKQEGENNFLISIPCIGCGNDHTYLFTKKSILLGDPIAVNCPETGMEICFVGRDEAVRKKVDSLEEKLDEIINMYGYESYFDNTQVMFDTLNHIHDIALKGNLQCECGNNDVELVLLSDCILLRCVKCGSSKKIQASKNKDLKEILMKNQILITEENLLTRQSGDKFGK